MELEEMKSLWLEMSATVEKQKKLTDSIIIKMTRLNFNNKLNKIKIPETIASVVSFSGLALILFNFSKLDTWYLRACGIASVLILFVLPVLSLWTIKKMQSVNIADNNLTHALRAYAKRKLQFVLVQKTSFYLGILLMLAAAPVEVKLIDDKDLLKNGHSIWFVYVIGFPFCYLFYKWTLKKYSRIIDDAESILKELDTP